MTDIQRTYPPGTTFAARRRCAGEWAPVYLPANSNGRCDTVSTDRAIVVAQICVLRRMYPKETYRLFVRRATPSRLAEVERLERVEDELLKENHSLSERGNRLAGEAQDLTVRAEAAEKRVAELKEHERILRESQQRTVDDLVRSRDLAVRDLVGRLEKCAEERLAKCAELHGYAAQISAARLKGADAARREAVNITRSCMRDVCSPEFVANRISERLGKEPAK